MDLFFICWFTLPTDLKVGIYEKIGFGDTSARNHLKNRTQCNWPNLLQK